MFVLLPEFDYTEASEELLARNVRKEQKENFSFLLVGLIL